MGKRGLILFRNYFSKIWKLEIIISRGNRMFTANEAFRSSSQWEFSQCNRFDARNGSILCYHASYWCEKWFGCKSSIQMEKCANDLQYDCIHSSFSIYGNNAMDCIESNNSVWPDRLANYQTVKLLYVADLVFNWFFSGVSILYIRCLCSFSFRHFGEGMAIFDAKMGVRWMPTTEISRPKREKYAGKKNQNFDGLYNDDVFGWEVKLKQLQRLKVKQSNIFSSYLQTSWAHSK